MDLLRYELDNGEDCNELPLTSKQSLRRSLEMAVDGCDNSLAPKTLSEVGSRVALAIQSKREIASVSSVLFNIGTAPVVQGLEICLQDRSLLVFHMLYL